MLPRSYSRPMAAVAGSWGSSLGRPEQTAARRCDSRASDKLVELFQDAEPELALVEPGGMQGEPREAHPTSLGD
jgi:hypothetical protein